MIKNLVLISLFLTLTGCKNSDELNLVCSGERVITFPHDYSHPSRDNLVKSFNFRNKMLNGEMKMDTWTDKLIVYKEPPKQNCEERCDYRFTIDRLTRQIDERYHNNREDGMVLVEFLGNCREEKTKF